MPEDFYWKSSHEDTSEMRTPTNVNVVKLNSLKLVFYKGTSELTQRINPNSMHVARRFLHLKSSHEDISEMRTPTNVNVVKLSSFKLVTYKGM